jgi:hypothetical protein
LPLDIAGLAGVGDGLAGGAPLVAVVDHWLAGWLRCGKVHCQRDYNDKADSIRPTDQARLPDCSDGGYRARSRRDDIDEAGGIL